MSEELNDILESVGMIERTPKERVLDRLKSMSRRLIYHMVVNEMEPYDPDVETYRVEAMLKSGDPNGDGNWQLAIVQPQDGDVLIMRGNPETDPLITWNLTANDGFWEITNVCDLRPVPAAMEEE